MKTQLHTIVISTLLWAVGAHSAQQTSLFGVYFSPYKNNQDPSTGTIVIPANQLNSRLKILRGDFQWIQTSSVTHGLGITGVSAHKLGFKTALGAWIGPHTIDASNETEINSLISVANHGEADMLIVGNGVLSRGDLTPADLIAYLDEVRASVPAGIPITTIDSYDVLLANPDVLADCDVIMANMYPYWEGVRIDSAISKLDSEYATVVATAGGKPVYIAATGWPTAGSSIGDAVPNPKNAAYNFLATYSWAADTGADVFYYEAFDEPWMAKSDGVRGKSWGIRTTSGSLKQYMNLAFQGYKLPSSVYLRQVQPGTDDPSSTISIKSLVIVRSFASPTATDKVRVTGTLAPLSASVQNTAVTLTIGNTSWQFTPLKKDGSATVTAGQNQTGKLNISPNKNTWKFTAMVTNPSNNSDWDTFGLVNATLRSPGIPVFMPVIVSSGSISVERQPSGFYTSRESHQGSLSATAP